MTAEEIYQRALIAAQGTTVKVKEVVNREEMSDVIEGIRELGKDSLPMFCMTANLGVHAEEVLIKVFNNQTLTPEDTRTIEVIVERLRSILNK